MRIAWPPLPPLPPLNAGWQIYNYHCHWQLFESYSSQGYVDVDIYLHWSPYDAYKLGEKEERVMKAISNYANFLRKFSRAKECKQTTRQSCQLKRLIPSSTQPTSYCVVRWRYLTTVLKNSLQRRGESSSSKNGLQTKPPISHSWAFQERRRLEFWKSFFLPSNY